MSLMRRRAILQSQQVQEIGYKDGTYDICSVENDVWRAGPADTQTGFATLVPFKSPFRIEVGDTIKLVYDGYQISGVSVMFAIGENIIANNIRPTNGFTKEITATTAGEAQTLLFRFAGNTSNTFVFTPHIYLNGIQKA